MSFENIIGNNKIKQFLTNTADKNQALHSYLFVGIDGIGKKLFAKEFARVMLCLDNKNDTEEKCLSCIKWNSCNHPDFKLIEPENNTIKIEQIRNMQETITEKPIVSDRKIYIIEDSDCMTKEAQNCLLKTLEEPPEYAIIILTTSNESKLLNTIKSRCMKVSFDRLSDDEMEIILQKQLQIQPSPTLMKMSEGSIGKLIIFEQDKEIYEIINNLLDSIQEDDLITTLNKVEILYNQKEKIQDILGYMSVYLYNTKDMKKINCIKHIEDTKKRLFSNSNYDMCIDNLVMKIWEEVH